MSETKHTPYKLVSDHGFGVRIHGSDNIEILSCIRTDEERESIAEFIVRACNSHAQLVEALEAVKDCGERAMPEHQVINMVDIALAVAKRESDD